MGRSFAELSARRVVLVTGKGGVGRTTVAAAIARAGATAGKRTLLAEIREPVMQKRSPLAVKLGRAHLASDPIDLGGGLSGVELCTERGTELFLTAIFRVATLAKLALRSQPLVRFLHAVPSFRELGILYHLLHLIRAPGPDGRPAHELIVLDMPASGHTLALTGLPEVLLNLIPVGPIAHAMREGQTYLHDPRYGAAYVVTLPEKLPVSESLELIEGLRSSRVPLGGVIVNRLPDDPFTEPERAAIADLAASAGGRVLGLGELGRVTRARDAVARLRGALEGAPVLAVDERTEEGPALIEAIAGRLLAT